MKTKINNAEIYFKTKSQLQIKNSSAWKNLCNDLSKIIINTMFFGQLQNMQNNYIILSLSFPFVLLFEILRHT